MSEAASERKRFTPQEYFDFEYAAMDERHMYLDGQIIAMSGGTYTQSLLTKNMIVAMDAAARARGCTTLESNMRVRYGRRAQYGYTDGLVVCGEPEFDPLDQRQLTLTNPLLIVEVLSDSTELFDRTDKFALYREIESFREYLLVSQRMPRIETFFRQPDGSWQFGAFDGLEARIPLRSLGAEIVASDVYRGVAFPSAAPPESPAEPQ